MVSGWVGVGRWVGVGGVVGWCGWMVAQSLQEGWKLRCEGFLNSFLLCFLILVEGPTHNHFQAVTLTPFMVTIKMLRQQSLLILEKGAQ